MSIFQRLKKPAVLILIIITLLISIVYLLFKFEKPQKNEVLENLEADNSLQTACKIAINDYPEWTKIDSNLVIWETPGKSFNYRNAPEEPSIGIASPVKSSGTLADMDFVGQNEFSYVNNQNNLWQIGLFKLNGMNAPDNSIIYEQAQHFSFINISPINKKEFIVFLVNENIGFLKYLNITNNEESILSEFKVAPINLDDVKLAVSPKGTYVYLLHNKTLTIFAINSKKEIGKIDSVESIVWLGNSYLLYSNQDSTFIYNVETKKQNLLGIIDAVLDLNFNPQNGGVFAYTQGNNTQIVDCATTKNLGVKQDARLRVLASNQTAIIEKENFFGYWKFKNADWTVTFIEKNSKLITVWGNY